MSQEQPLEHYQHNLNIYVEFKMILLNSYCGMRYRRGKINVCTFCFVERENEFLRALATRVNHGKHVNIYNCHPS